MSIVQLEARGFQTQKHSRTQAVLALGLAGKDKNQVVV